MNLWIAVPAGFAALTWLAFIVYYWIRATWWRGPLGRNTMFVSMALFLVLFRITILNFFPNLQPNIPLGVIFYGALGWLAIQRIVFAEKSQREQPFRAGRKKFKPDGK